METITREDLYKLVWAEPIVKIAPRYGLSDRGMGKLCARYEIPVPPRGHWARKAAGKRVSQQPLPRASESITITFSRPPQMTAPVPEPQPVVPEIEFERDPVNFVVVEPNERLSHPLVKAAAAVLRGQLPGYDGVVHRIGSLDVRVSPSSLSRALRTMQALIRALERRGHKVAVKERTTEATVLGEPITIFMRERLKRTLRDLTPDERRRRREGHQVDPYVLQATGELSLNIDLTYGRSPASDAASHRLEECINRFIEALITEALRKKRVREEREREELRRQDAERLRRKRLKRQRQEEARIHQFNRLVEFWKRTQERRAFVADLRSAVGTVAIDSELARWLDWAETYVTGSDPLDRFRTRAQTIKLYFSAYNHEIRRIRSEGFEDQEPNVCDRTETEPGIVLQDRRPEVDRLSELLEFVFPEELVLPYEVTEPGYVPRLFCIPSGVLNEHLGSTQGVPSNEGHATTRRQG